MKDEEDEEDQQQLVIATLHPLLLAVGFIVTLVYQPRASSLLAIMIGYSHFLLLAPSTHAAL